MKIVIAGGSGQVGTILARAFHRDRHQVVVLSRRSQETPWPVVEWDGRTLGEWARELEAADAVINLAGRSVNCRYTRANREEILASRVLSTRAIGGDRKRRAASTRLVAGEHCNNLFASLRCAER